MVQPSEYFHGLPRDLLQHVHILLRLGASELDAALQVGSHKSKAEVENHLPQPAGQVASVTILMDLGLPSPKSEDHECGNSEFPLVDIEILRDQLYQLNIASSMGNYGIHPRVLKEPVDASAAPLSIIYQKSSESREVSADPDLVLLQFTRRIWRKSQETTDLLM